MCVFLSFPGSGPQELGQFMISHCPPRERATIERAAVEAYFGELSSLNPLVLTSSSSSLSEPWTMDHCWAEYVNGGLGRWLFFLPYDGWGAHHSVSQYFCDQVLAFIKDHNITPETVPMPRL